MACIQAVAPSASAISAESFRARQSSLTVLETEIESGKFSRATKQAPRTKSEARCQAAYRRLYSQGQLSISIVYGYNDQRPYSHVIDGDERAILHDALVSPCRDQFDRLCGFSEDASGVLHKQIEGVDGENVNVGLRLRASSVSSDDNANRVSLKDRQTQATAASRAEFARSLKEDDVVFYIGHARNGGGPDFRPPLLNGEGKVDLLRYQTKKEGLKLMTAGLARATRLKLLGVFACLSNRHFSDSLLRVRSDVGYLLAGEVTKPTPMNFALWGVLHSVLGRSCEKAMAAAVSVPNVGVTPASFTLTGFFD
jgi:hypothetical protein